MSDLPRYRLTQPAYMPPAPGQKLRVLEAGTEVDFAGTPGYHMEPINDAARAAVKKLGDRKTVDPERAAIQALATQRFDPNAPGLAG